MSINKPRVRMRRKRGPIEVKPTDLKDYWGRPIYLQVGEGNLKDRLMYVDVNLGVGKPDFYVVEARPLTHENLNNPAAFEPLWPSLKIDWAPIVKIIQEEVKSG